MHINNYVFVGKFIKSTFTNFFGILSHCAMPGSSLIGHFIKSYYYEMSDYLGGLNKVANSYIAGWGNRFSTHCMCRVGTKVGLVLEFLGPKKKQSKSFLYFWDV